MGFGHALTGVFSKDEIEGAYRGRVTHANKSAWILSDAILPPATFSKAGIDSVVMTWQPVRHIFI